jgi:hypothetical protein
MPALRDQPINRQLRQRVFGMEATQVTYERCNAVRGPRHNFAIVTRKRSARHAQRRNCVRGDSSGGACALTCIEPSGMPSNVRRGYRIAR